MKHIIFGIAIMVFGLLLGQALDVPDLLIIIDIIGLVFAIIGFVKKEK